MKSPSLPALCLPTNTVIVATLFKKWALFTQKLQVLSFGRGA